MLVAFSAEKSLADRASLETAAAAPEVAPGATADTGPGLDGVVGAARNALALDSALVSVASLDTLAVDKAAVVVALARLAETGDGEAELSVAGAADGAETVLLGTELSDRARRRGLIGAGVVPEEKTLLAFAFLCVPNLGLDAARGALFVIRLALAVLIVSASNTLALLSRVGAQRLESAAVGALASLVESHFLLRGVERALFVLGRAFSISSALLLPLLVTLAFVHALSVDRGGARESTLADLALALIHEGLHTSDGAVCAGRCAHCLGLAIDNFHDGLRVPRARLDLAAGAGDVGLVSLGARLQLAGAVLSAAHLDVRRLTLALLINEDPALGRVWRASLMSSVALARGQVQGSVDGALLDIAGTVDPFVRDLAVASLGIIDSARHCVCRAFLDARTGSVEDVRCRADTLSLDHERGFKADTAVVQSGILLRSHGALFILGLLAHGMSWDSLTDNTAQASAVRLLGASLASAESRGPSRALLRAIAESLMNTDELAHSPLCQLSAKAGDLFLQGRVVDGDSFRFSRQSS